MFKRFLKLHRFSSSTTILRESPKTPRPLIIKPLEDDSLVLKIVHQGGNIELYYMAIPAAKILERYPICELAKPDVFTRPWSSVVRPDKILTPGHKFFLVPRSSMKKLRKRINKPTTREASSSSFFSRQSDVSSRSFVPQSVVSRSSSCCKSASMREKNCAKKNVRFAEMENNVEDKSGSGEGKQYLMMARQPRLAMINEGKP